MKLMFLFVFVFSSSGIFCQTLDLSAQIVKTGNKFFVNENRIFRYEVNRILKTDKIATSNYNTGSYISILGGCIITGTMLSVSFNAIKSISALAAGGYSYKNKEPSINPEATVVAGGLLVVSGIIIKRNSWKVYNKKFKKDNSLSFSPIIDSNKLGVKFTF